MQTRNEWLENRSKMIGASDVAAILGENPFRTNIDVWMDKTGRGNFDFDNDHLAFGRDVEGAIAGLYNRRTNRPVRDLGATVVQVHPDIPWLGATLDRLSLVECPDGIMRWIPTELKHVGGMFVKKDEWVEDPPSMYQIQVQIQCECYRDDDGNRVDYGSLSGMFPGYQLGFIEMERSSEFFEHIYPTLDEFWNHYVKKDIQPPYIPHERALDTAKRLYSAENGKTVALNERALYLANEMARLTSEIGDRGKEKEQIQAELRLMMGDNTFASLPDGTFLTLKTTSKKEYTVAATSYRTLRRTKRLR